jgi:hypothetical protein
MFTVKKRVKYKLQTPKFGKPLPTESKRPLSLIFSLPKNGYIGLPNLLFCLVF